MLDNLSDPSNFQNYYNYCNKKHRTDRKLSNNKKAKRQKQLDMEPNNSEQKWQFGCRSGATLVCGIEHTHVCLVCLLCSSVHCIVISLISFAQIFGQD